MKENCSAPLLNMQSQNSMAACCTPTNQGGCHKIALSFSTHSLEMVNKCLLEGFFFIPIPQGLPEQFASVFPPFPYLPVSFPMGDY